jgi:hypothetical protein
MTTSDPRQGVTAVSNNVLAALVTVMAQAATGGGSCDVSGLFKDLTLRPRTFPFTPRHYPDEMTIRQFMELPPADQLAVINQAWNKVFETFTYNKHHNNMVEPTSASGDGPLPSSWCPTPNGDYAQRHKNPDGSAGTPFRTLGVGFRCDGTSDASRARVLRDGMTAQVRNLGDMRDRKGWEIENTVMMTDTSRPRVWRGNHDLLNESAVCVARNFFGATAFPTREMVSPPMAYLWAVDVTDLVGFDTEEYQVGKPGSRQWRPGEKAFREVPANKLLAWVKFWKRGDTPGGGWKFLIPAHAQWTIVGNVTPAVRRYIDGELDAWRGKEHFIPPAYDFAT